MSTTAKLETPTVQMAAGSVETIPLQIRNDSDIVEGYRLEVLGVPSAWATIEPAEITGLYPGAETTATVAFHPPRNASAPAGELSFGVRIVPTEHPEQAVVPEGVVEVLPFLDTTAELIPRASRGRRGARHQLAVDNRGNVAITVDLYGADDGHLLTVSPRPERVTVEPGQAAFADVRVKPVSSLWRGPSITHPFTVTARTEETSSVTLDGTHLQEALVPRWLPKALLAALALLLLLAALWFLVLRPTIVSTAQEAVEEPVAQANERADEAAAQADEAAAEAEEAVVAAQSAQGAASQAGEAAVEANELVGAPVLQEIAVPLSDRLQAQTPPATTTTRTFTVEEGATVRLNDFVVSNPQGDFGRVQVELDGQTLFDLALENFRDVDYHFQSPIVAGSGAELTMTVRCDEVGVPPAQNPPPTTCDTAVYYGGTLARPPQPES
ncbi:hypothetical protein [Georgenia faecalis]|uniref:Hydrolytic protein n=1 Tax=Georgenia faecalis TaxID=2483799 RepID=A0ABV9DBC4_9MICO|nr:hypothetical protein [Georgenia faecalis]